jgi:gamma-glutamyltranspeptidase/glutathione hydrolase
MSKDTSADLSRRGHDLRVLDDWSPTMGSLSGIVVDPASGALKAGADPRRDTYAAGR